MSLDDSRSIVNDDERSISASVSALALKDAERSINDALRMVIFDCMYLDDDLLIVTLLDIYLLEDRRIVKLEEIILDLSL